jgi:hypothetical protein
MNVTDDEAAGNTDPGVGVVKPASWGVAALYV